MKFFSHLTQKRFKRHEDGQSLILFVLIFFLVIAAAVGAIDYGTYIRARQRLEITVDAAVLAGGLELPTSGTNATSVALQYIDINDSDVDFEDVTTSFRCLVGDRNNDGYPDAEDIPTVCDPGAGASFTCEDGLCISDCEFTGNNTCNVMALTASKDVPLIFTRLLGLQTLVITTSKTGACKGLCGEAPTVPLDVIIVLDRTISMSSYDLANAKAGALAVLELFDPEVQHVGLAVLNSGDPSNPCFDKDADRGGNWLVVPLSDDYQNADGTLDTSSQLVSTINCLATASQTGTNLGSPLSDGKYFQPDALEELLDSDRDVKKGIILLTDGAANEPTINSCSYANSRASIVKDEDIEIFTIGYGVENDRCIDRFGAYKFVRVTELLADMATDSLDDYGHCLTQSAINNENADGDHFMCQPQGGDLAQVFRVAAAALSTDIKLIPYPGD